MFIVFLSTFSPFLIAWEGEDEGEIRVYKDAQIITCLIPSGEFRAGERVSAYVTIKNTGEVEWTFYVGFSVQDPKGEWWDAPYESITLKAGEAGNVTLFWTVNDSAPAGFYNARVAVWKSKTDNLLTDMLDSIERYNVFKVIASKYQLYGYVKYVNENGDKVPLGGVKVEIRWGIWPLSGSKSTITNSEGFYAFQGLDPKNTYTIEASLTDGNYIEVIDGGGIPAGSIGELASFILKGLLKPISKRVNDIKLSTNGTYNVQDIIFSDGKEDDAAVIFVNTLKAVNFYTERLHVSFGGYRIPIVIFSDFPTQYWPIFKIITIHKDDSGKNDPNAPDNREWHEFSHYVMNTIFGSMPPKHKNDNNHGGYENHCTSDSWTEGFAEFMSLVISSELGGNNVDHYAYFGSLEDNWRDYWFEEFAVAGILWDLYDGSNTRDGSHGIDDDGIDLTIEEIWGIISERHIFPIYYKDGGWVGNKGDTTLRHIYYLKDLYDVFSSNYDVNLIEEIFSAHDVPGGLTDPNRPERR